MEVKNFNITSTSNVVISFALCSPNTNTFACTSFPVFSVATTDGTSRYDVDTPLRNLWPTTTYKAATSPAVSYHAASGTGTITFTYGSTYSLSGREYESSASPRRYRYLLHASFATLGTAYSAAYTAYAGVVLGGSINMLVASAAGTHAFSVCSVEVT